MLKTTLMSAAIAAAAAPAIAGGLGEPAPQPTIAAPVMAAPMAPSSDWSGPYGGISLGYGDVSADPNIVGDDFNGLMYGVFAGYDFDFGSFVVGGELELSGSDISDDVSGIDVDSVARAKLRAGYDAGRFLPYITAGAAQLNTGGAIDESDTGYFYGIGADYKATERMRVGVEALRHEFQDFADTGVDLTADTISARVAFDF